MKWEKIGCIFTADGSKPWMQSHAAVPVALDLGEGLFRIYCSTRDSQNRSSIAFVEIDIRNPLKVLRISPAAVLSPGPLGYFDDHGVFAGTLIKDKDRLLLYYLGWNPGVRQPLFYCAVGLAESHDGGLSFNRVYKTPVIGRDEHDPWAVLLPHIIKDHDSWRMWYGSGIGWEERDGQLVSYYNIRQASSQDGLQWTRDQRACIELEPGEFNVAHPFVMKSPRGYRMWYSYNRGQGYRLGLAESADGTHWLRKDEEVGIKPSTEGWDSESVSHAHIITHAGETYMLYNGNGFGRTGFGIARLTDEN